MKGTIWKLAASMPIPSWLSFSLPSRHLERWLTDDYGLQRRALTLVPEGTQALLDVGCGGAAYLKGCDVPHIIGMDANKRRLAVAKQYCDELIWWDLNRTPPLLQADCVLCLEVIEHLLEGSGYRLFEWLGHYRTVILSTPRGFFTVRRNGYEGHLSHWSGEVLSAYGFELVEEWDTPPSNIYVRQS